MFLKIAPHLYKKLKIKFAYLFGSRAKGTAVYSSDYDIALLFDHTLTAQQILTNTLKFTQTVSRQHKKNIDAIALNNASSVLKYEVIAHGRPISSGNELERITFEVLANKEYIDDQFMRDIYTQRLVKNVLKK